LTDESAESRIEKLLALWRESDSNDYATVKKQLLDLRTFVQEEIARRFGPVLNKELKRSPQQTLLEKQKTARWANSENRSMDLCIRCPKTNEPAMLFADRGRDPAQGRFQIELLSKEGGRRRTVSSSILPTLDLIAHPQRREPLAEHWEAVVRSRERPGESRGRK
jgi:hypothetical protein